MSLPMRILLVPKASTSCASRLLSLSRRLGVLDREREREGSRRTYDLDNSPAVELGGGFVLMHCDLRRDTLVKEFLP